MRTSNWPTMCSSVAASWGGMDWGSNEVVLPGEGVRLKWGNTRNGFPRNPIHLTVFSLYFPGSTTRMSYVAKMLFSVGLVSWSISVGPGRLNRAGPTFTGSGSVTVQSLGWESTETCFSTEGPRRKGVRICS